MARQRAGHPERRGARDARRRPGGRRLLRRGARPTRLAQQAWALFQAHRSATAAWRPRCSRARSRRRSPRPRPRAQKLIEKRKQAITGVSEFANIEEARVERKEPDWDAIGTARQAALAALSVDDADTSSVLRAKPFGAELVQAAIEAAGKGAGLAQLSAALATVDRRRARALRRAARAPQRGGVRALRDASDARGARRRQAPERVPVQPRPDPAAQGARAVRGRLLQRGRPRRADNDGFATPEAAAEAFAASGTKLAAICGSDKAYPEWVARVAPLLEGARRATRDRGRPPG